MGAVFSLLGPPGQKHGSQKLNTSHLNVNTRISWKEKSSTPPGWSEQYNSRYPQWLNDILEYNEKLPIELHPAVQELADLIENNTRIKLLAAGMCDELVSREVHKPKEHLLNVIRTYQDLLKLLNYLLRVPPLWNTHMFIIGILGCPFNLLLLEAMQTTCGFALFQDPGVNVIMKNIINAWGQFLMSPSSASCLNESPLGWFGPEALTHLIDDGNNGDELRNFEDLYICDPSKPHWGYTCWDKFFTRQFREGIRPLAADKDDYVIANVCESTPWRIAYNAKNSDKFWAKGGPYSLDDMLGHNELSNHFIGGTVYQAYLSALAYHRWHSPVNGTIVQAFNVSGMMFSQPLNHGFGLDNPSIKHEPRVNWEQAYLTATASRAIVFIEANNPEIGLMAVVLVGMYEVSSCELKVTEGQRVTKGQEIGMFHFGGSTHCVLFRPGVQVTGLPDPNKATRNHPVRSELGRVLSRKLY